MDKVFRKKFITLWLFGFIGAIAVLPYAFSLQSEALTDIEISTPILILASLIQSGILLAIVVYFGIKVSLKTNLKTPFLDNFITNQPQANIKKLFKIGIISGAIVATLILSLEFLFKIFIPVLDTIESPPLWQGLLASFYGAFTEELIVRYFLMSLLVWMLFKIFKSESSHLVFVAILSTALIFGLLHLPAMSAVVDLTPLIIVRVIILNAVGGIIFGYLFWKHGLEFAVIAHFTTDILLQIISRIL